MIDDEKWSWIAGTLVTIAVAGCGGAEVTDDSFGPGGPLPGTDGTTDGSATEGTGATLDDTGSGTGVAMRFAKNVQHRGTKLASATNE